ncbi:MAG: NAD-dependent DNA ligase LigA [Prevotella sp.]|nr:NAD-dependent DNA ligase LigA [Prevotella sp.]
MAEQTLQRIHQLVEELNQASEAYYNGKAEQMTDYEWDARFDELKRLEEKTGIVLPESPTQKVSEDNVEGQKEEHEFPALSLAKTKQTAELVKWAEGRPIWISWKLDGLTLVATYDNGKLTKVVTRGNGHLGTNITHLAKAINGIPQNIEEKGHTVIRGEAVISYEDFDRFLLESGEDYANPRNLASGSLTLKDVEEVRRRNIRWIPFTLVYSEQDIPSWGQRMEWLRGQGFSPVDCQLVENPDLQQITAVIDDFTKLVTSNSNPYPVDGLVVSYDDTAYAQTGSVTGHHATRAGLAFKWQDEAAETELIEIEWSCAASTISPVAIFRPVELEGTTVKRASLCNISECERLGIGGQGTKISVIKANKIIPKVISVNESVGTLHIPEHCPVCQAATTITTSEGSGTRTLHCTNPTCPAKQLKKYARFVSKDGMDIDGMSEQTLAKFVNLGWIQEYADIYKLRNHIRDIASLEGFGEKSAANIMRAIEKAREVDAQKLLIALSIPKCGPDVAKRLLVNYTLEQLMDLADNTKVGDGNEKTDETEVNMPATDVLSHIDGIGPERSALIIGWFKNEDNKLILRNLLNEVRVIHKQVKPTGKQCDGLTFVITGDVHHYKNRNELKAYIESQGGKVTGSVSNSTSFLINNDVTSTSGKNKKAQELGITILSEDDFISRFGTAERTPEPEQLSLF